MYILSRSIASLLALLAMTLGPTPLLGQASQPPGQPDEVVVPSPPRPRGEVRPPVLGPPGAGESSAPRIRSSALDVLIPAGTGFPARLTESLSSKTARPGDRFEAVLDRDLTVDGKVVVPRGSLLVGVVEEVLKGGRVKGRASLTVALRELRVDDEVQQLTTSRVTVEAGSSKKKDARTVGIATGIGAALGAVLGGKSGAAVGAAVGGSAGGARVLTSRGKAAVIEKEQLLTFRLEEEATLHLQRTSQIDP